MMLLLILSVAAPIGFLIFLVGSSVYMIIRIYSSFYGAPYISTREESIDEILARAHLRQNTRFLELGCGDGLVLNKAVRDYGVIGEGVDINPVVIHRARRGARDIDPTRIHFTVGNISHTNIAPYQTVYLFLLPQLLTRHAARWKAQSQPGTLFISHGFKIHTWRKHLIDTINATPYDTYYYRM